MGSIIAVDKFPLEGRNLASITRDEIIRSIPLSPVCEKGPSVARVSSSAVVKWGRHVHLSEARNMRYVSEHTQILLPNIIDAWELDDATEDESNTCYIFMEYVTGKLAIDIWDTLDEKGRQNIHSQLHGYICQLQALEIKTPGPIGGGISRGALFTRYDAGPFHSAKDLEDWYNDRLLVCRDFGRANLPPGVFSGTFQKLVMCHLDFNMRNVIMDEEGKVWLIDWGLSGAYPPWFEETRLAWGASGTWEPGLLDLVRKERYKEDVARLVAIFFALTTGGYCQPRVKAENKQ